MNILIVEDSATLRHLMCLFIKRAGHTPVIAENGEQALQIFDSQAVDMVIMDIEMPGLDGLETTRIMRDWLVQEELWLPIIFVTGKNEEDDLREGIEVGGDDYLIKPVSETILTAKIRAMERIIAMRNELQRLNDSLIELSERDSLTHLYNRRTFDDRAEKLWKQAAREGDPMTVLLMDIDHFKPYNDFYGHLAGDVCIQDVANAILEGLNRPSDLLARYGGEEFIVMLPNTDETGAKHVAERVRKNVSDLKIPHQRSLSGDIITLSVGGAVLTSTSGAEMKDQIHAADQALYLSKSGGRDLATVKLFSPRIQILVGDPNGDLTRAIDGKLKQFVITSQIRNEKELLEQANEKRPDAVILHESLGQDGVLDLAQQLQQGADTSLIPVFVVTQTSSKNCESAYRDVDVEVCVGESQIEAELVPALNRILFN